MPVLLKPPKATRHTPVALTGTPGTGKTAVARSLQWGGPVVEVSALAISTRTGRPVAGGVEVDIGRLSDRLRYRRADRRDTVWVGHLAHLLPVRDVVLLRCHPLELQRRLQRAGRGSSRDRAENVVAEATDFILLEAISLRRRVWEVDTTGREPEAVARDVDRLIRRRPRPSYGRIDWLSDPNVTEHLLRQPR